MLREQMISFLQAAVVFLLLTNALSALAALYAMRMASGAAAPMRKARTAVERKLDGLLGQAG
jgi:hypothetical protein